LTEALVCDGGLNSRLGILTGHTILNRHVTVMKICSDPTCPACGAEEEETSYHFLCRCCARILQRYSILGSYFLVPVSLDV